MCRCLSSFNIFTMGIFTLKRKTFSTKLEQRIFMLGTYTKDANDAAQYAAYIDTTNNVASNFFFILFSPLFGPSGSFFLIIKLHSSPRKGLFMSK